MKIKITTDSTVDVPNSILTQYGISDFRLIVNLGEKECLDVDEVTSKDIEKYVDETGKLPKTAARSVEDIKEFFKSFLDDGYDEIVHISLSSELSSTHKNALTAAFELCQDKIHIVDGRSLSTGTALLAIYASELANTGLSGKDIANKVSTRAYNVQASFVVNTLNYLYKGGRCSMLAMFGANLLKLKPRLQLINGKIVPTGKYRGKMNSVLIKYVDDTLEEYNNPDPTRCFITHADANQEIVDQVVEYVKSKNIFKEIIVTHANSTIFSHCGKGTLGILYINDGGNA